MSAQQERRGLRGARVPSPFRRRALHNRALVLGGSLLFVIVGAALFAPILAPYTPVEIHPDRALEGSSTDFLLGTDMFGRDQLSRILYGARISSTSAWSLSASRSFSEDFSALWRLFSAVSLTVLSCA